MKREFDINAGENAIVYLHCRNGRKKTYALVTNQKKSSAQLHDPAKTKTDITN